MTVRSDKGQAILEVALVLPILLIILSGAYASVCTALLKSRAESAALTEALRAGRNHAGIGHHLSHSVTSGGRSVAVRSSPQGKARLLPPPFPALTGRTKATVTVRKEWMEIGVPGWLPEVRIERNAELSADSWGKETSSGKNAQRWIRASVVLGAIR